MGVGIKRFFENLAAEIAAEGLWGWFKGTAAMTVIVGFVEWLWGRSLLEALGLVALVMILWFGALELFAKWKGRKRAGAGQQIAALTSTKDASGELTKAEPKPVFGCPRQGAREAYKSWPHIPVTLDTSEGEIRNCTVELDSGGGLAAKMRWQSGDSDKGVEEITLIGGRTRMVPIAIRCEVGHDAEIHPLPISDGTARITGAAYLRDGDVNKFTLLPGRHVYRLRIRSGSKMWESTQRYLLNAPGRDQSNGQFYLEIWHEGKD